MFETLALIDWFIWAPIALWVLFVLGMMSFDSGLGATVATIAAGCFFYFFAHWNPLPYVEGHVWQVIIYVIGYVCAGCLWAVAKWTVYSYKKLVEFETKKSVYENTSVDYYHPKVSQHKADIIVWMSWWPFSMVMFILNDPLRHIFTMMYNLFGGLLQRITDRIFAKHLATMAAQRAERHNQTVESMLRRG